MKKAFLFDMNGTMVDDMAYHVTAWREIVNKLGANLSVAEMKRECYGKNDELLERIFPGRFTDAEKKEMGYAKEKAYQETYRPYLQLLPGLQEFMEKAEEFIRQEEMMRMYAEREAKPKEQIKKKEFRRGEGASSQG